MPKNNSKNYKKYIIGFWVLVFMPFIFFGSLLAVINYGFFGKLPTFEELENPESALASEVISADGIVLGKYYIQNRTNIRYSELSPNLINSLKATEDIRFEDHSGVDIRGLLRVLIKSVVLQQDAGGGSTITQQLAKNLFPRKRNQSKSQLVISKLKEWITATKLERNYTKEEIIAMYFNTVEFSGNAFGIKSASRTFFSKAPDVLTIEEAAMLVGMLKGPTLYSPVRNPKNALGRRNTVIDQLQKYDFVTATQADSIKKIPVKLNYQPEDHKQGIATYFRETLRLELLKWCRERNLNLYRDGLRIYTTIDSRQQQYAEDAVAEHMPVIQKQFDSEWKSRVPWADHPEIIENGIKQSDRFRELKQAGVSKDSIKKAFDTKIPMTLFTWKGEQDTLLSPRDSVKYYKRMLQTGFMSLEPGTGLIRAWVGGNDYHYFKYDHVKEGRRQVGSTFKPFVYAVAMQEGYSPCYKVPNIRTCIDLPEGGQWCPDNSDNKYGGMYTLKEALANSVNVITAYLIKQFGAQTVVDMAQRCGIESPLEAVPAIALGVADLNVMELVGAYGTFANKGVWTQPVYLLRIEDKNGVVLQEFVPKKVEAISEETAYLMVNLLQGVTQHGTGLRLRGSRYGFTNAIAGKTGTTQNNSDGWFVGMVPNLVAGCWVGCDDRSVHFRSTNLGQGANTALPIWALFMKKCYADTALQISKGDFDLPLTKPTVETDCSKYKEQEEINSGSKDFGVN